MLMGLIRFLLAFSVVYAHLDETQFIIMFMGHKILLLVSSDMAVQIFFMISGFYMALILSGHKYSLSGFYKSRFFRLYPLYLCILLATVFIDMAAYFSHNAQAMAVLPGANFFASFHQLSISGIIFFVIVNLMILGLDICSFLSIHQGHIFFGALTPPKLMLLSYAFIGQAWSVSLEIMFYLLIPFIFFRKRKVAIILGLMAVSILIRAYLYAHLHLKFDPWTYRFFPNELVFFLGGVLAFLVYDKVKIKQLPSLLVYLLAIFVTIGYGNFFEGTHLNSHLYHLFMLFCIPFIFHISKDWKFDRFIGELSYPIYISHILLFYCTSYMLNVLFMHHIIGDGYHHFSKTITSGTICVVSLLLYLLVQKPVDRFRHHYALKANRKNVEKMEKLLVMQDVDLFNDNEPEVSAQV